MKQNLVGSFCYKYQGEKFQKGGNRKVAGRHHFSTNGAGKLKVPLKKTWRLYTALTWNQMWQELLDVLQETNSNNFAKNKKLVCHSSTTLHTADISKNLSCVWIQISSCYLLKFFFLKICSPQIWCPCFPLCNKTTFTGNLNLLHAASKSCINLFIQQLGWADILLPFRESIHPLISNFT